MLALICDLNIGYTPSYIAPTVPWDSISRTNQILPSGRVNKSTNKDTQQRISSFLTCDAKNMVSASDLGSTTGNLRAPALGIDSLTGIPPPYMHGVTEYEVQHSPQTFPSTAHSILPVGPNTRRSSHFRFKPCHRNTFYAYISLYATYSWSLANPARNT